ncbi:Hypothetical protein CINCED_3A004514 [Cinara cedri]|uniref:Uncharacterized protein n=1 Tax=Cinara cedri TaxID=506608 RepID=A0A5E4MUS9_9HEMI|nr:Hypothetical protein CINCED_3A004514 [Cinara cedri]
MNCARDKYKATQFQSSIERVSQSQLDCSELSRSPSDCSELSRSPSDCSELSRSSSDCSEVSRSQSDCSEVSRSQSYIILKTAVQNVSMQVEYVSDKIKSVRIAENTDGFQEYQIDNMFRRKSDIFVSNVFLEIINSTQNFAFLNCNYSPYYNDKVFYGFTMSDTEDQSFTNILEILDFKLKGFQSNCSIKQWLLIEIIDLNIDNIHVNTIYGEKPLRIIIQKIQQTNDFELILWYQNIILKTFIKLLNDRIIKYLNLHKLPFDKSILHKLNKIFNLLFEYDNLPKTLRKCIKESRNEIHITSNNNGIYNTCLSDYVDENQKEFEIVISDVRDSMTSPKQKLKNFLRNIMDVFDSFTCFFQLYQLLNHEFNSYFYIPYIKTHKKINDFIRAINNQSTQPPSVTNVYDKYFGCCRYAKGLYQACFEVTVKLNNSSMESIDELEKLFLEADAILTKVEQFIVQVIREVDFSFVTILYQILPLLQISKTQLFKTKNLYDSVRLVHVIMNLLNDYGLEFCKPPDFNFMLFNNMEFGSIGRLKMIFSEIEKSVTDIKKFHNQYVQSVHSLQAVYTAYYQNERYLSSYDEIIKVYWKGDATSLKSICEFTIKNITLHPYKLYKFYDLYFSFTLAVLYFEIDSLRKDIVENITDGLCSEFNQLLNNYPIENLFPDKFDETSHRLNLFIITILSTKKCKISETDIDEVYNDLPLDERYSRLQTDIKQDLQSLDLQILFELAPVNHTPYTICQQDNTPSKPKECKISFKKLISQPKKPEKSTSLTKIDNQEMSALAIILSAIQAAMDGFQV